MKRTLADRLLDYPAALVVGLLFTLDKAREGWRRR